jgi:hypothetical protein
VSGRGAPVVPPGVVGCLAQPAEQPTSSGGGVPQRRPPELVYPAMAAQFGGRGECRRCGGTGGRVWGRCGPAAGRARPAPLASRGAGWRNGGLVSGGRKKRGRTPRLVFYVTTSACMTRTRWSRASRAATWRAACAARTHGARALRGRGLQ